jgi:hypothetical protein
MENVKLTTKQRGAIAKVAKYWFCGIYSLQTAENEYAKVMYNILRRYNFFKAKSDMEKAAYMHNLKQDFDRRLLKNLYTAINNA